MFDTPSLADPFPSTHRAPPTPAAGPALHELGQFLEASPDCVVQLDRHGRLTYLNAAAQAELGLAATAGEPLHWRAALGPQAHARRLRQMALALARHGRWEGELVRRHGDAELPFHALVVAHRDGHGHVRGYSAMLRNVAFERLAQSHIQRQTHILKAITEAIPATVVVVDIEGRYRFANRAFERYCNLPNDQIIGRRAVDILGADEVARRKPYMLRAYAGESVDFTLDYRSDAGTRWLSLSCVPLKVDGVVDGFVGIGQDVTELHAERDRLTHLAESDKLTGLLNRAGFEHVIEAAVRSDRSSPVALLYIDLDHFKPVNDQHGHPVGDRLLQLFAERLRASTRASDKVARLGGDEFAVLLAGVRDPEDACRVADKVLAAARAPFEVDGRSLGVTASIGVAFDVQPQAGWRELVARADAMLYRAKAQGRDRAAC